ncbi:MAG: DUF7662 domain-containing protein [Janthinobacterium lividum]
MRFFTARVQELRVNDALKKLPVFPEDEDLLDIIDILLKESAVLLVSKNKLVHIVTGYDTNQYFRRRAEDIVLLEDIEGYLKGHLKAAYTSEDSLQKDIEVFIEGARKKTESSLSALRTCIEDVCNQKGIPPIPKDSVIKDTLDKHFPPLEGDKKKTFDKLSLNDYIDLAKRNWSSLETVLGISKGGLSKDAWATMMYEVRNIRNDIFHFRSNITPVQRQLLRFCANWYKARQSNSSTNSNQNPAEENTQEDYGNATAEYTKAVVDTNIFLQYLWQNSEKERFKEEISIEDKYAPLASFLKDNLDDGTNFFDTSIDLIEKIIKQPLPKAAREHNSWWHDYSPQSRQWLQTGWSVGAVNLNAQQISFYRWSYIINETDAGQLTAWSNELGCSEETLREMISKVGPLSTVIKYYIQNKQGGK